MTEALPDPHFFCIGVYFNYETPIAPSSPKKDSEMLFYLDARIDKELNRSVESKGSESPRWMEEEAKNLGGKKLGLKKCSAYTSKETCRRTNNTIDTMMEVPDEAYNDIRDFTDIDLNVGSSGR